MYIFMKIAIFGASGGIGKFVVKRALDKEYKVTAFVRNPSKLDISHDKRALPNSLFS